MNREDFLIELNYDLDINLITDAANKAKELKEIYTDSRYNEYKVNNWLISKYIDDYIEKVINDFEVNGSPRFYWLKENTIIPPHVDNDTTCSINFILSAEAAPVCFERNEFYYRQCLLNTAKKHWVRNSNVERILFKISIFDETFESLSKRIKFKLTNNT